MAQQRGKNFPPGTRFQDWFVTKDSTPGVGGSCIKRFVILPDGSKKTDRLSISDYKHIRQDETELRRFVVRLNGRDPDEESAKERFEYRHAFISSDLLMGYREGHLSVQIPSAKDAGTMFHYLNTYGLAFFINKLGLADPLDWHRQQDVWARSLLNKPGDNFEPRLRVFDDGDLKADKVLRQIVYELNRFLRYLHRKRPAEVPPLELDPFTKAALKDHEARRKLVCEVADTKYIKPQHREDLFAEMKRRNLPWRYAPILAYAYGLRRNESLGQRFQDVRRRHLEVEAQLDYFDANNAVHKPVKDKEMRRVPHWVIQNQGAHFLIGEIQNHPIHPDTLSKHFSALTEELFGEDGRYTYHDLRRTWITDMLKEQKPEDVRLAAGHANIETTYRHYVKDTRELDDDIFVPDVEPAGGF